MSGLMTGADLAAVFINDLMRNINNPPDPGQCTICGSETYNERLGRHNDVIHICDLERDQGLACHEVWLNRIWRNDLPTYAEFCERNYYAIADLVISDDPRDYDLLEFPWRDERDSYHDYHTYIKSREWNIKSWRAKVLAGWACARCGYVGGFSQLHAHHLTYDNLYQELKTDVEVLCRRCHKIEHRR